MAATHSLPISALDQALEISLTPSPTTNQLGDPGHLLHFSLGLSFFIKSVLTEWEEQKQIKEVFVLFRFLGIVILDFLILL